MSHSVRVCFSSSGVISKLLVCQLSGMPTESGSRRERFLLPVQKTRQSIEKQLAEHVARQKDLPKNDQWGLKVALRQQAKAHDRRQRQDKRLRQSEGWEERRLGTLEYFLYKMKGFVIWCMVDLEGPVTRAVAKGAILASLKRHAKLRARIVSGQRFQAPPLGVFLEENLLIEEPDSDPVAIAEREMKLNRLAQGKGLPRLWDVYLTGHEGSNERSAVIFVNHALMDGMSLALWLCEIQYIGNEMVLRGGTAEAIQSVIDEIEPLPLPVNFERHINWWPERMMRLLSPKWMVQRAAIAAKGPVIPRPCKSSNDRTSRISIHWLSIEETKQILARVKEEETSVTGAVGAAGLVAIRSMLGDDSKDPHLYAQINICLRANAVKRGAFDALEELGQMSIPLNQVHAMDNYKTVWDLARKVRSDLRQSIKKGEYFETIKEMAYCRATSAFTFPVVVKEFKKDDGRYCALNVISMGDQDEVMPQADGPIRGVRIAAGVDISEFGPHATLGCLSTHGKLGLFLTTVEPIVSPAQAQVLMDRIISELKSDSSTAIQEVKEEEK